MLFLSSQNLLINLTVARPWRPGNLDQGSSFIWSRQFKGGWGWTAGCAAVRKPSLISWRSQTTPVLCVPSLPAGPDHTCCAAVGLPAHLHAGAQETEEESVPTALLTLQMHLSLSASIGTYAWGKYITDFTAYLHKNCYLKISKRKQKEAQSVVLVQQ